MLVTYRDEDYRVSSAPESETDDELPGKFSSSAAFRGHPWRDDDDDDDDDDDGDSTAASRSHSKRAKTTDNSTETESTRRSTRRRRQNYSPQAIMDSSESEEEEGGGEMFTGFQFAANVPAVLPDNSSKIERILGRRVLANTKEAEEVIRRNRYAIVRELR